MSTINLQAEYISSTGRYAETCGVCCRKPELCGGAATGMGRMNGIRLTTGIRHSEPVCGDCLQLLILGDWAGLERLVFEYQAQDWTRWEAIIRRRRARKVARNIAHWNRDLFANLADPNDAPREQDENPNDGRPERNVNR